MTDEMLFLAKRLRELSDASWQNSRYLFSDFLSEPELAVYHEIAPQLSPAGSSVFGGYDGAERCMVCFGSEEAFGYTEPFPITCLLVRPLLEKFAEPLTHRDFLGALMNLGIERSVIGDLVPDGTGCYLFCKSQLAGFICENLTQVRRTHVACMPADALPENFRRLMQPLAIQAASARIDAAVSKLCSLSRNESLALFRAQKVFLNGAVCENNACLLKENDLLSVRGYGKFRYLESTGTSRKGKLNLSFEKYVS